MTTMVQTRKRSFEEANTSSVQEIDSLVRRLLDGITTTETKSGWCLREGLRHLLTADDGRMIPLVEQHGPPLIYSLLRQEEDCRHKQDSDRHDDPIEELCRPKTCFQSLCRIIAGQQLAGAAARTIWNRLLETTKFDLTPTAVVQLANDDLGGSFEEKLQKPAGLSRSKAQAILALAQAFQEEKLGESFLTSSTEDYSTIRESLLEIKGIGPWSCDMFQMFYLEQPNVLPLGDLGVRKGIAKCFGIRGSGKGGTLCPKKDLKTMQEKLQPYHPYHSLVTYYMWKAADSKDVYIPEKEVNSSTPVKGKKRKIVRQVTP